MYLREEEAERFASDALGIDPHNEVALYTRLDHAVATGNDDAAARWVEELLSVDPFHHRATIELVKLRAKRGDKGGARTLLERYANHQRAAGREDLADIADGL